MHLNNHFGVLRSRLVDICAKGNLKKIKSEKYYPRPHIPTSLKIGILVWILISFLYPQLEEVSIQHLCLGIILFGIVFFSSLIFFIWKKRNHCLVIAFVCLSCISCFASAVEYSITVSDCLEKATTEIVVDILEDGVLSDFGYTTKAQGKINDETVTFKISLSDASQDDLKKLSYGSRLLLKGEYRKSSDTNKEYYFKNNLCGNYYVHSIEEVDSSKLFHFLYSFRESVSNYLDSISDGEELILLKALLLGDRAELFDSNLYQNVRVDGLAHLVAVSGAHLIIFSTGLALLFKWLRLSNRTSVILTGLSCLLFLVFSGFSLSCLRASVMSICAYMSVFSKRRSHGLSALGVLICISVIVYPAICFSLSFLLSVTAVLGIALYQPLFKNWLAQIGLKKLNIVIDSIVLTISASVLTFGISASLFGQISMVSLIANLVAALSVPYLMGVGLIACLIGVAIPVSIMGTLLHWFASIVCWEINALAMIPYASIPLFLDPCIANVLTFIFAGALWWFWPSLSKKVIALGLVILMGVVAALTISALYVFSLTRLVMLDVGQGDAFLLQSRGHAVLIDTGNQDSKLVKELAKAHIYHLDAVVISHPDDDHCGSLKALRGVVQVDHVYVCKGLDQIKETKIKDLLTTSSRLSSFGTYETIQKGTLLKVGTFDLRVVGPARLLAEGGNEDSICIFARADIDSDEKPEGTALLVGDAESEQLKSLIDSKDIGRVDILKIGHHGSKNALTKDVLKTLKPKYSLISVGKNNRYGHPAENTLSLLKESNSSIFRTDISGSIACNFSTEGISVCSLR